VARRAVDDDVLVVVDAAVQRVREELLAMVFAGERQLELGQLASRREQIDTGFDVAKDRSFELAVAGEELERRGRRLGRVVAEPSCQRELRVEVDRQDPAT